MAEVYDLESVAQQSHSDGEGTDAQRWSPTEESGFYHLVLSRVCDISACIPFTPSEISKSHRD